MQKSAFLASTTALAQGRTPEVPGGPSPYQVEALTPNAEERKVLHDVLVEASPEYKAIEEDDKDRAERVGADVSTHLAINGGLTLASMATTILSLPAPLAFLSPLFNGINFISGVRAICRDVKEIKRTFKDPDATHQDRVVDVTHLAMDVAHTAADAAMVVAVLAPAVLAMSHPAMLAVSVASGVISLVADVGKSLYDVHRKRQMDAALQEDENLVHQALQTGDEGEDEQQDGISRLRAALHKVGDVDHLLHEARKAKEPESN